MGARIDRWKVWKSILGGGLGLMLALGALYGWLALKPTGHARLAQTQAEAVRRVQATLISRPELPNPASQTNPRSTPEQVTKDSSRIVKLLNSNDFHILADTLSRRWESQDLQHHLLLTARDLGLETLPAPASLESVHRAQIIQGLRMFSSASQKDLARDLSTSASGAIRLDEALPPMEHLMLDPGVMNGDFQWLTRPSVHPPSTAISRFLMLGAETVMRAARRGDSAKAGAMLVELAVSIRRQYIESFPTPTHDFRILQLLLLRLTAIPNFPQQRLEQVAAVLDRATLSTGQFAALRFAEAQHNLQKNRQELSQIERQSNNWHYLYDGKPERLVAGTLASIMRNKLEEGAVALAAADADRMVSIQKQINRLANMMNLNRPPLLPPFKRNYMLDNGIKGDLPDPWDQPVADHYYPELATIYNRNTRQGQFNDEVTMTRIPLAIAHYRLAQGRLPGEIADLVPRFLDPGVVQADGSRWALWSLPEAHGLNTKGIRTMPGNPRQVDPNDPFMLLWRKWGAARSTGLPTYEDMLEIAEKPAERETVEQHKGGVIPASLAIGRIRQTTINATEWEKNERASNRPNEELLQRVKQERFGGEENVAAYDIEWIGLRP